MPCGANELAHRSLSPRGVLVGISKCVRRGHAKGWDRDPRVMRWYGSKPRTEARCASRPAFGSSGILPSVLRAQKGGVSHVERAKGVEGRVVVARRAFYRPHSETRPMASRAAALRCSSASVLPARAAFSSDSTRAAQGRDIGGRHARPRTWDLDTAGGSALLPSSFLCCGVCVANDAADFRFKPYEKLKTRETRLAVFLIR